MWIRRLDVLTKEAEAELVESTSVLNCPEPIVLESVSTEDRTSISSAVSVLRRLPTPTVLLGDRNSPRELVEAVDICVTTTSDHPGPWVRADVDQLFEVVRRQPLAAMSLVVLLREARGLDAWKAMADESAAYAMLLGSAAFQRWLAQRGPLSHKPSSRSPVRTERIGDVLRITLDRPDARNAIDSAMRDALVDALVLARVDPDLHVELRGEGPCFSSGGDLSEFGLVKDPALAHAVRLTRHPGMALDAVSRRVDCYVHGRCIGAGVELPAFASRVVGSPGVTFELPEVSMGLVPGAGGTVSISRRIGRHRTAWLALSGTTLNSAEALTWGLIDEVQ